MINHLKVVVLALFTLLAVNAFGIPSQASVKSCQCHSGTNCASKQAKHAKLLIGNNTPRKSSRVSSCQCKQTTESCKRCAESNCGCNKPSCAYKKSTAQ